jgi:hypothetical protein
MQLLELYDDFDLQYRYGYISDMVTVQNDKKVTIPETKLTVPVTEPIPVL